MREASTGAERELPSSGSSGSSGARTRGAADGSGQDALPAAQQELLRRAIRLERWTLAAVALGVLLVGALAGQSQSMKAAWMEDSLSLLPPLAFLIAARRIRRRPTPEHPYGHHRSIGMAHMVASVALLGMGAFLVIDSATTLLSRERAPVGITVIAGHAMWTGWLMILVMALTTIGPVILGRKKAKLAEPLHDKVLYADADMNKADWQSALATIVGVLGIGIGWWWADAVCALLISASIIHDGVKNLRGAVRGLADARARTYDDSASHPLTREVVSVAEREAWVREAAARVRDEGHVFHVELFVVPAEGTPAELARLCEDLRERIRDIDWKLHDIVVAPVTEIPAAQVGGTA
ncbi:cation transporter [Brachybacterium sp. JHP9]|uniref:Cation transporter n=1 Tax=Brachybacterium equifaecis TaxID=2910770 RepID=A0ABT0R4M4_9MICO|nr:cation transporter [Brachybacterium equifaecis]